MKILKKYGYLFAIAIFIGAFIYIDHKIKNDKAYQFEVESNRQQDAIQDKYNHLIFLQAASTGNYYMRDRQEQLVRDQKQDRKERDEELNKYYGK
jgi:hypothetical protein